MVAKGMSPSWCMHCNGDDIAKAPDGTCRRECVCMECGHTWYERDYRFTDSGVTDITYNEGVHHGRD